MWPTLYTQQTSFGSIPYNSWGLMITLAFLAATLVAHGRAAKVGINPDQMVPVYMLAIFCGLMGARLLHFLMATPEVFFADPLVFFKLWQGGFAFYGGFIVAGIAVVLFALRRGMDVWKVADVMAPVVMLGLSIGRIGCFLAGCCHGRECPLPPDASALLPNTFTGGQLWFMSHTPFFLALNRHGVGENNIIFYPTQLWESAAAFSIFLITSAAWKWFRRFDGQIFGMVMVLYACWRPVVESMRGDEVRGVGYLGFLTTSQLISIPVGVVGLVLLLARFNKGIKPEKGFIAQTPEEENEGSRPVL